MTFKINSPKYGEIEVLIDDEDWKKVKKYSWCVQTKSSFKHFYVRSNNIFWIKGEHRKCKRKFLHEFITKCPEGLVVDHVNHNTLDNRKENLRICTQKENMNNRIDNVIKIKKVGYDKIYSGKIKSKYHGISFEKNKYWRADINKQGKRYYLGNYKTEHQAVLAYNKKAYELYGSIARLNKIEYF